MIEQIWDMTRLGDQAMESHYVNVDSVTRRSPIHPSQSNESTTMFFLHHNNHPFILCCNIYPSNHPRSNDDTIRPCLISNCADNDVVKGNVTQYTRPRNRFTIKWYFEFFLALFHSAHMQFSTGKRRIKVWQTSGRRLFLFCFPIIQTRTPVLVSPTFYASTRI